MKIEMRDGRVFEGTPVEIVRAMRALAFGVEHLDLREYVAWVVANARKFEGVELAVTGTSEGDLAASLVEEMVRHRLTQR